MVLVVEKASMGFDLDWLWLIIPGGYLIISTFFLCFPLWPKYSYRNRTLNALLSSPRLLAIGHRGGGFEGPENTL
jgi:glycerophosphoryl diester phosphodiesterase